MKRFAFATAALALLSAFLALPALAYQGGVYWVHENEGWLHQRTWNTPAGANSGSPNVIGSSSQDTTFLPMAASQPDTSGAFTLTDCMPFAANQLGRAGALSDSTVVAWIVIASDSTVASSVNFKNTTVALQLNMGSNSANWATAITYSPLETDGTKFIRIPISMQGKGNFFGIDYAQTGGLIGENCRLIVTGGTAVAAPMCRVYLLKPTTP